MQAGRHSATVTAATCCSLLASSTIAGPHPAQLLDFLLPAHSLVWPPLVLPQADSVDIAYPPLVQSGGDYDLRLASVSKDTYIHYGVIICSLGARCAVALLCKLEAVLRDAFRAWSPLLPLADTAGPDQPHLPCLLILAMQVRLVLRQCCAHLLCGPQQGAGGAVCGAAGGAGSCSGGAGGGGAHVCCLRGRGCHSQGQPAQLHVSAPCVWCCHVCGAVNGAGCRSSTPAIFLPWLTDVRLLPPCCCSVQAKGQEELIGMLPKNVGTAIGLELRDSTQALNASNTKLVKAGMTFNVAVGEQAAGARAA